MSLGKMNTFVDIIEIQNVKDSEGFAIYEENLMASIRAYKEEKYGSKKWANLSAFTEADCLFKFRVIPNLEIKAGMVLVCDARKYEVISIKNIRGMYIEALTKKVEAIKG